ncbi:MAG: hypothetical protein ACLQVW_06430 [Limisphaerales bacterium]
MNSNPVAAKALIILLLAALSAPVSAQPRNTNQPSGTFTSPPPRLESRPGDFDFDTGFSATWAAEKHLLSLFRAEGFPGMRGVTTQEANKNGIENSVFERASDGAKVNYTHVRTTSYAKSAEYRLSASRNSPGMDVLLSIAGKVSADRLAAMKEAIEEFKTTKKPVIKQHGDFKTRGDFRVKVDENTVELDDLWKGKGI